MRLPAEVTSERSGRIGRCEPPPDFGEVLPTSTLVAADVGARLEKPVDAPPRYRRGWMRSPAHNSPAADSPTHSLSSAAHAGQRVRHRRLRELLLWLPGDHRMRPAVASPFGEHPERIIVVVIIGGHTC